MVKTSKPEVPVNLIGKNVQSIGKTLKRGDNQRKKKSQSINKGSIKISKPDTSQSDRKIDTVFNSEVSYSSVQNITEQDQILIDQFQTQANESENIHNEIISGEQNYQQDVQQNQSQFVQLSDDETFIKNVVEKTGVSSAVLRELHELDGSEFDDALSTSNEPTDIQAQLAMGAIEYAINDVGQMEDGPSNTTGATVKLSKRQLKNQKQKLKRDAAKQGILPVKNAIEVSEEGKKKEDKKIYHKCEYCSKFYVRLYLLKDHYRMLHPGMPEVFKYFQQTINNEHLLAGRIEYIEKVTASQFLVDTDAAYEKQRELYFCLRNFRPFYDPYTQEEFENGRDINQLLLKLRFSFGKILNENNQKLIEVSFREGRRDMTFIVEKIGVSRSTDKQRKNYGNGSQSGLNIYRRSLKMQSNYTRL